MASIDLAEHIIQGKQLSPEEASLLWDEDFSALLCAAAKVREYFKGTTINLCSIVNAKSGACSEDCRFCAQSAHHAAGIDEYALLSEAQLLSAAQKAQNSGARCFGIVTSGRTVSAEEIDRLCSLINKLHNEKMCISVSLGEMDEAALRKLKSAGLTRFHHNLETAESHFPRLCSTHTFSDRLQTVRNARNAGLELCCGGIFGVGETREQRVEFFCSLRELQPESVPLNFLHPVPGTPLGSSPALQPQEILRTIAVCRLLLPKTDISVCGGREVNLRDLQSYIFQAGANGMMTGGYLTTSGRPAEQDRQMIEDLGLTVNTL